MKTCLITLHSINNPGSALQAYALSKYLNDSGIENEIIDYRPFYSKIGTQIIKGIIRSIVFYKNEKEANLKYSHFMKNMILSKRKYYCFKQLKKNPPDADVYICGSDQLWNPDYECGKDKSYTLEFVREGKKIAYSTSVGKASLTDEEEQALVTRIGDFAYISVREKSTSTQLSKIMTQPVEWVCDPVFLLKKDYYLSFCTNNKYGDYAVMYLAVASPILDEYIEYIKRKTGLKIIQAGGNIRRCQCDIHLKNIGPEEFLTLIHHAKFVISGSFHATAFSLLFQKDFSVFVPENNGERINSILDLTGLQSRVISFNSDFEMASKPIEYSEIEDNLTEYITNSKKFIEKALRN